MIKKGSNVVADEDKKVDTAPTRKDDMMILGLAEIIRVAHSDRVSLALGLDSEAIITALSATPTGIEQEDKASPLLSRLLTSPWSEVGSNRRGQNSLESILPACYNVQAPPHAATRLAAFTEETLFYMFYGMPRDRMQEMAARELTLNRGWRYHKEMRLWILASSAAPTAASMTAGISQLRISPFPSTSNLDSPTPVHDSALVASYIAFDPNTWSKVRKEFSIIKEDVLEDRFLAERSK
jgi:CCR4-NOT transcription complex subunit 2